MIELFKDFSSKLCDDENLSLSLSEEYFDVLSNDENLIPLLKEYRLLLDSMPKDIIVGIQNKLLIKDTYKILVKKIIKLWYLGKSENPKESLKGKNHYYHYEALIWKVLHAHPAGLTGGYYGYWSYKPEN